MEVTSENVFRGRPSAKSTVSGSKSIFSRLSEQSTRDRASSAMNRFRNQLMGFQEDVPNTRLRCRDWTLAVAELCLSFSWTTFMVRDMDEKTLQLKNMTPREKHMDLLFYLGWAFVGNLIVGLLMDGYFGSYTLAISNVSIHFILASMFFANEIVSDTLSQDEYGLLLSNVFAYVFIPIKSCGFSRYVFAMEQLPSKNSDFVHNFSFIVMLSQIIGQSLFFATSAVGASTHLLSSFAFVFNSAVFYIYLYVLVPPRRLNLDQNMAFKFWNCFIIAVVGKVKYGAKVKRKSLLDYADIRYDKNVIAKTKKLLKLILIIIPTMGFLLFTYHRKVLFASFEAFLAWSGKNSTKPLTLLVNITVDITMILMHWVIIPIMRYTFKIKFTFIKRFLMGYTSILFAVGYAMLVSSLKEKFFTGGSIGTVRLFSTFHDDEVIVQTKEASFSQLRFTVLPQSNASGTYGMHQPGWRLVKAQFYFPQNHSLTTHLSISAMNKIGYVLVEPEEVLRIPGFLPLWEAPPGNNNLRMPRCFAVNFIRGQLFRTLVLSNMATHHKTKLETRIGITKIFQVQEGMYRIRTHGSNQVRTVEFLVGGVYGIYLYQDFHDFAISVDKVLDENTASVLWAFGVKIPVGIALGVALVALRTFVFYNAPDGLKGIASSFLACVESLTSWVLLLGFHTWHKHIAKATLGIYFSAGLASFCLYVLVLLKFKNLYTIV